MGSLTISGSSTNGQSIRIKITACSDYKSTTSNDETYDLIFHSTSSSTYNSMIATDGHSKFYGNGQVNVTTSNTLRTKPFIFLVKQAFVSGNVIYSLYYHSGAASTGVARVSVDNPGFVLSNPMVLATLSTSTDVFISLPINFIYSTANPITSNDLTWLADYQSFNNFYTKTQSDAKYPQIQMSVSLRRLHLKTLKVCGHIIMDNIKLLYNRVLQILTQPI